MKSWCERQDQIEIGIIEHEGRSFAALGASVQGPHVTGYTRLSSADIGLATWCGKTMLSSRSEIVEEFHDGSLVLIFRLTKGRFIVGYALGKNGMLFRGELVSGIDDDEAKNAARRIAVRFSELDAEDEAEFDSNPVEQERLLEIEYRCPECDHEWREQWTSACDSECPHCGLKNITALSWDDCDG